MVSNTHCLVTLAADGLLDAVGALADSDGGDGDAVEADVAIDAINRNAKQSENVTGLGIVGRLDAVAAIHGASVAVVTASTSDTTVRNGNGDSRDGDNDES